MVLPGLRLVRPVSLRPTIAPIVYYGLAIRLGDLPLTTLVSSSPHPVVVPRVVTAPNLPLTRSSHHRNRHLSSSGLSSGSSSWTWPGSSSSSGCHAESAIDMVLLPSRSSLVVLLLVVVIVIVVVGRGRGRGRQRWTASWSERLGSIREDGVP